MSVSRGELVSRARADTSGNYARGVRDTLHWAIDQLTDARALVAARGRLTAVRSALDAESDKPSTGS